MSPGRPSSGMPGVWDRSGGPTPHLHLHRVWVKTDLKVSICLTRRECVLSRLAPLRCCLSQDEHGQACSSQSHPVLCLSRRQDEHDTRLVTDQIQVLCHPSSSSPKVHEWAIWLHNSTGVVVCREQGGWLRVGSSGRVRFKLRKVRAGHLEDEGGAWDTWSRRLERPGARDWNGRLEVGTGRPGVIARGLGGRWMGLDACSLEKGNRGWVRRLRWDWDTRGIVKESGGWGRGLACLGRSQREVEDSGEDEDDGAVDCYQSRGRGRGVRRCWRTRDNHDGRCANLGGLVGSG